MDETGGSGSNSSKSLPEKEKGDANEAFTGKKVRLRTKESVRSQSRAQYQIVTTKSLVN